MRVAPVQKNGESEEQERAGDAAKDPAPAAPAKAVDKGGKKPSGKPAPLSAPAGDEG